MTSPRTPRQWGPGDSEPDRSLTLQDQDRDLIAYNFDEARGDVGWRYTWIAGHETYYGGVPWSEFDENFRTAWPLSEVLPETPEPPQVGDRVIMPADWRTQLHRVEHGAMDSRSTAKTVALIESWISSSPLPDSETEWGVRVGSNDIPTRTDEDNARHIATFGGGLTAVSREVGPWIEVTS